MLSGLSRDPACDVTMQIMINDIISTIGLRPNATPVNLWAVSKILKKFAITSFGLLDRKIIFTQHVRKSLTLIK